MAIDAWTGGLSPTGEHSGTYLHLNRGKRNVCLDLKKVGARSVIARLVAAVDVIVSNMRPKALERLGLDAATIAPHIPKKYIASSRDTVPTVPTLAVPPMTASCRAAPGSRPCSRRGTARRPMCRCSSVTTWSAKSPPGPFSRRWRAATPPMAVARFEVPMFETMATFVLQEHLGQQSFHPPVGPVGDRRL